MNKKITPWIVKADDFYAFRHIVGADPEDISKRVALIEKSPRVRIREGFLRLSANTREDGTTYVVEGWPEHLDWCYGTRGDGFDDPDSIEWCNNMLRALGYEDV